MTDYQEIRYRSHDGLELYARDYANPAARHSLLCMHGLTRNSADFEPLCEHLAAHYRIVSVDQRGRGKSDYDPEPGNYQLPVYVQDMFTLIEHLGLHKPILVGTSMGGLMAMGMQALKQGEFTGLVLNDIGAEINADGLDRIKQYVGKTAAVQDWAGAVETVRLLNGPAFPDFDDQDWQVFARRIYAENAQGVPELLYDAAISQGMEEDNKDAVAPDLWPIFESCLGLPVLLIRGELSDILHTDCVAKMQRLHAKMQYVEVSNVGHAPVLDEPQALAAIQAFFSRL